MVLVVTPNMSMLHTLTHACPHVLRCSGETLLTLITDILDFSRIEANKMVLSVAPFKVQTTVEAAMEIAGLRAAQKRLQVGSCGTWLWGVWAMFMWPTRRRGRVVLLFLFLLLRQR